MTEAYDEDFEEIEDEDLRDEIDELTERLDEQAEIDRINATIRQIEDAHGSRFTQAEAQQIGELLDEGYTPQSAYEHVAPPTDFEQDFLNAVQQVEALEGRTLLESETDRIWQRAQEIGDPYHVEQEALVDLDTPRGRSDLFTQRLMEQDTPDVPDTVEPLPEDASPQERVDHVNLRLGGAEVEEAEE